MKKILIGLAILAVLGMAGGLVWQKYFKAAPKAPADFNECVALGNPVMESYPRRCRANGQIFVEEIDDQSACQQAIRSYFIAQYQKYAETIEVNLEKATQTHARGSVIFVPGQAGGIFLAVKIDGQWRVVHEGSGQIACNLREYGFPDDMLMDCAD